MSVVTVLLTGGTIGQRHGQRGSVPDTGTVMDLVRRAAPPGVDVRIRPVMQRNSPDITPQDWENLAATSAHELDSGSLGVVVLHGTDTLAYTAAALHLSLSQPAGPVVVTGSMAPADAPSSDAAINLASAIQVAATTKIGVCVVMGIEGPEDVTAVLDPMRVLKVRTRGSRAFTSAGVPAWGYVQDYDVTLLRGPQLEGAPHPMTVRANFDPKVDVVKISPMTDAARLFRLLADLRGVVIEGYGAGHVSAAHLEVLAGFRGPVVLTTQVASDAERLGAYASDRAILELPNVIPAGSATSVASVVALSWALAQDRDPRSLFEPPTDATWRRPVARTSER